MNVDITVNGITQMMVTCIPDDCIQWRLQVVLAQRNMYGLFPNMAGEATVSPFLSGAL